MAITKLLRLKESPGHDRSAHLRRNIAYICNPQKTHNGIYVGGNAGADPAIIYTTMMQNKALWQKEDGSQGFHYVLSFPPDCGIDENTAYQFGEEFCRRLLGEDYYYVFAVHDDQRHMHVHVTFDSVSKADGMKFHSPHGDWERRIQPITDDLCRNFHLPVLELSGDKQGVDYGEWKHRNLEADRQQTSWYDIIRDDIDEALRDSESMEELLEYLRTEGYEVWKRKYLSVRPPGRIRAVRTGRLGDGYSAEQLKERIGTNREKDRAYKIYGNPERMKAFLLVKTHKTAGWKMSSLQRQFYKRWNNTCFIRKPGYHRKVRHRSDIVELSLIADAFEYLAEHDIRDLPQLSALREETEKERNKLDGRIRVLSEKLRVERPFILVSEYEKVRAGNTGEERKIRESIRKEIEKTMPFQEAAAQREAILKERRDFRLQRKSYSFQIKEMDRIFRLLDEERERGTAKPDLSCPAPLIQGLEEGSSSQIVQPVRITINHRLFQDMGLTEDYLTRIPGMKNTYIRIPKNDCFLYESGEILSAYIYDSKEYEICSSNGTKEALITGTELKTHYEDKTDRKISTGMAKSI